MAKNKKEIKELADLPYYREEYTAQLEKMGITDLPELLAALKDSKKKAKIVDELEGVGVKIADHWIEVLEDVPEESTAVATKGSKTEIIEEADAEVVEKGAYVAKIKPVLSAEVKAMLEKRAEVSGRRPEFLRQEWFRYAKLGKKWRKPRGMHSKMRRHYKYRHWSVDWHPPDSKRYWYTTRRTSTQSTRRPRRPRSVAPSAGRRGRQS
jgi:large subunit ribosomal protein L32e